LVEVTSTYDAESKSLTLDLRQSAKKTPGQDVKEPFVIPIELGLISETGEAMPLVTGPEDGAAPRELQKGVIELTGPNRRLRFHNLPHRPVASLLRGFSAPVRLAYDISEADLI